MQLTELDESVLALNGLDLGQVVDVVCRAVSVAQFVMERERHLLQEDEH